MKRDPQLHCHITVSSTNLQTGERRQLTEQEIAERFEKILAMSPVERVKMGRPTTKEQG